MVGGAYSEREGARNVKREIIGDLICFAVTVVTAILLRCLQEMMPNPVFATLTPLDNSPWKLGKLVFWPLIVGELATRRMTEGATARGGAYLTLLLTTGVMIAMSWLLRGYLTSSLSVYLVVLAAGILLYALVLRKKCPCGELVWAAAAILLGILFLLFTAMPPAGALFMDSQQAAALVTIPM
jgi:hypothetical protein